MGDRLIIRRSSVGKMPIVVEDFDAVEFYDPSGELQAFISTLGANVYAFSSSADPDWEQAKTALGFNNGDIGLDGKKNFFGDK